MGDRQLRAHDFSWAIQGNINMIVYVVLAHLIWNADLGFNRKTTRTGPRELHLEYAIAVAAAPVISESVLFTLFNPNHPNHSHFLFFHFLFFSRFFQSLLGLGAFVSLALHLTLVSASLAATHRAFPSTLSSLSAAASASSSFVAPSPSLSSSKSNRRQ